MFYYLGVAIEPNIVKNGHMYVASVHILEEDGERTSLGELGQFANSDAAYSFAVRCGTAFVEGQPLPIAPCQSLKDAGPSGGFVGPKKC